MARTYDIEPIITPNIFRDIVATVSANLSTDNDLNIPQVSFKHGSWLKIQSQLIEEAKSQDHKNVRFPMVALIHRYTEGYSLNDNEFTGDLIIFALRTNTDTVGKSYTGNFPNVLNPIYAELRQVICDSSYFLGYNHAMKFPKMDIVDAGESSQYGNVRYEIPEHTDAIVIKDLTLRLHKQACSAFNVCSHGYEVSELNYIGRVDISGLNAATLTVGFADEDVIEVGVTPTYAVFVGTNNLGVITGGSVFNINVSGYQNGHYTGKIVSSVGAEVGFAFTVANGRNTAFTKVIQTRLVNTLPCFLWPDFPYSIVHSIDCGGAMVLKSFESTAIDNEVFYEGTKEGDIDASGLQATITPSINVAMTNSEESTATQKIYLKISKQY